MQQSRLDLSTLNEPQAEAVRHKDGPLVIYSGAGSGKTRVICYRIAYLIEQGVPPSSIMAVTFTNKAAREMRERVEHLVGMRSRSLLVSTFHSACARFLRTFAREIGYTEAFSIYDDDDQKALLKDVLKELAVPEKFLTPAIVKNRIDGLKNKGETPESYRRKIRGEDEEIRSEARFVHRRYGEDEHAEIIQKCYDVYQRKLKTQNAMDFNDLILNMVLLLENNERVLMQMQNRFRYFMVDEFQDTNPIQFRLMQALSSHTRNLCIVGDDDQSIYSWRGAEPSFILDFSKLYPDARTIFMEQNYRSTGNIVKAATTLIANNFKRAPKQLWTSQSTGEFIALKMYADAYEEANAICNAILDGLEKGQAFSEFGILYRTNAQSRALEDALRRRMLPYIIYGSVRFYERAEIKTLMAYLRLLANPDDDAAFSRVIGTPKRGFGDKALAQLKEHARMQGTSLSRTAARIARNELKTDISRGVSALKEVTNLFDKAHSSLSFGHPASTVLADIVSTIKFEEYLRASYPEDFDDRWLNVVELKNALIDYEMRLAHNESTGEISSEATPMSTLRSFLEEALLTVEPTVHNVQSGNAAAITLMTIHSSKGLEFDRVFISGLEEGVLPHNNSLESNAAIEEERRLLYVAITRARKQLRMSYIIRNRFRGDMPAVPSRFVFELPTDCIAMDTPPKTNSYSPGVRYEAIDDEPTLMSVTRELKFGLYNHDDKNENAENIWKRGAQVQHKIFGVGVVQAVEKSMDGFRLQILFPVVGIKKILHTFVTPVEERTL